MSVTYILHKIIYHFFWGVSFYLFVKSIFGHKYAISTSIIFTVVLFFVEYISKINTLKLILEEINQQPFIVKGMPIIISLFTLGLFYQKDNWKTNLTLTLWTFAGTLCVFYLMIKI